MIVNDLMNEFLGEFAGRYRFKRYGCLEQDACMAM